MLKRMLGNLNFKRKLASVALLMTLIISQFSIFGDADTAKVLHVGERQIWYKDSSLNGAETGFTNFTLGGKTAYCVDYRYYAPVSGTVPTFVKYFSKEATSVFVNGYPNVSYESLGCKSIAEAQLATQLALWSVLGITNECDSYVKLNLNNLSPANGHGEDFMRALSAAKKLSAEAFKNPYNPNPSIRINGSTADMKVVGNEFVAGPYKVSATDTSISKYTVSLTQAPKSAYVANAAGNKVSTLGGNDAFYIRWANNEEGQTINYSVKATGTKAKSAMYRNGKNGIQSAGQLEFESISLSVCGSLSFRTQSGSIELIKMDQHKERIAGVVFELRDSSNKVIGTGTSDANGVVKFADLKAGTYTLVEKSAPNGYVMGTEPFKAVVKTGEVFKLEVENTKVEGQLKIVKTDDEGAALSGVTFEILDSNKKVVDTLVTDANGLATSKKLPMGKYTYKETKVPAGIILDSTEYPFEITCANQVITKNIVNNRKKGGLKIIKVDDVNMPLSGVTFEILDANKNVVDTVVTDANGLATTKELKNGVYYYKETKVPAGVLLDQKEYQFNVTEGNLVIKKIVNQREKGNLKIVKVDDENKALAGVKFEILNGKKEVVDTVTTNAQGIATTKSLPVGTYYYKEVSVPAGIILDSNEYEFKLVACTTVTKKVVNQRVKGSLVITKVDDSDNVVAGVKFEIKDSQGNVVETLTTNAQGVATSKKLAMGKYTYKEIYAPAGYIMDTKEYEFSVTSANQVVAKKVVNKLSKGGLKIIKVDDSKNPLAGVKFEILDQNKKVIATLVTDENGVTNSEELAIGTYYYKEVSAPEGIVIDTKEYMFKVERDGQVVIANIVNEIVKGQLKVVKTDDDKKPLAGVKFEIYDEEKDLVDTIVTDKNGEAISKKLPYGKYIYKETEVPDGIILDTTESTFEVTEHEKVIVKEIVNIRIKGQLSILKLDEDTKEPISGVKFQVLDANNNVIETITTDKDGKAESSVLFKGEYSFKEVSAPSKYIVSNEIFKFVIKNNGDVVKHTVYNKAKKLPQTGGLGTDTLILLVVSVLSVLGFVIFKKKEEKNK